MSNESPPQICVPVCARRLSDVAPEAMRAAAHADLIEFRLDYLSEQDLAEILPRLPALVRDCRREVVLTLRSRGQGGAREISFGETENFLSHARRLSGDALIDIELEVLERTPNLDVNWTNVICSHHEFAPDAPVDVDALYNRLARTQAHTLKIAVRANSITDCLSIFRVLERARGERRQMIAIAMGEAGLLTRVLAPSRGARLTFGSLDAEHASAPGQITARDLRELYRLPFITVRTQVMGLVGNPVAHSVSPHMHNAAYAALGLDAVYLPFEVADLADFMRRLVRPATREFNWDLRGLSVTAPHKTEIINYLDEVDAAAREIGAVNTVVISGEKLSGHNTDADAAIAPLRPHLALRGARVAVLGAGGAARAVLWQLRREGARATVFARDPARATPTARAFDAECGALDAATFAAYDAVINTTPLGTADHREHESPTSAPALRGARIAYDLVYNPPQTRFLQEAAAADCPVRLGGLDMLVLQAAAQFRLWTGQAPPIDAMQLSARRS